MNFRQQQKAMRLGLQPKNMTEMYFSFVNSERDLLYLSATPINGQNQQTIPKGEDIPLGSVYKGKMADTNKNGIIIKMVNGQTTFLHKSTLGDYTLGDLEKSESITIEKIGYNQSHNKHIWKIISIS